MKKALRPFVCLFCLFLLQPVMAAGQETLFLPEKVILGESRLEKADLASPLMPEPLPEERRPLATVSPEPPPFTFHAIKVCVGNQHNLSANFSGQRNDNYLQMEIRRWKTAPFPEAAKDLSAGFGIKKMTTSALLNLNLSAGHLWDAPAVQKKNGAFVPAALPETGYLAGTFSVTAYPAGNFRPYLTAQHLFFNNRSSGRIELLLPEWTARAGFTAQINPDLGLSLFLDYRPPVGYGKGTESPEQCLPGLALNYRLTSRNYLSLQAFNVTNRQYRVLPGRYGPGTTVTIACQTFF